MKIVTAKITASDLKADVWDGRSCPGFLAVNRVVPSLKSWSFRSGQLHDGRSIVATRGLDESEGVGQKLMKHLCYQSGGYTSKEERQKDKATPFTFEIEVPDDVLTVPLPVEE